MVATAPCRAINLHDRGSRRHSVCCFGARALRDDNAAIGNCGYKGADVDDPLAKRSLADDPTFLARLAELDRGLNAGLDEGEKKQFPPPRQKPSGPVPAPPPRALRPTPAAPFSGAAPMPNLKSASRPLLDLFPPTPALRGG